MPQEKLKILKKNQKTKVVIEDAFGSSGVLSLHEVEQEHNRG